MFASHYDPLKRVCDVLVSVLALVVLAPIIALVALLVKMNLGSPVLFRQLRPGKDGQVFELIKFRTMRLVDDRCITDEQRMTRFGSILRSLSLDELPTLVNVLRGEMSLVGPRPLLVHYLERYTPEQARRHEVRPGITGVAQARGRNALTWEEKFILDVEYVDQRSLRLDLLIIAETFRAVFKREGITAAGHVTAEEFLGQSADREVAV